MSDRITSRPHSGLHVRAMDSTMQLLAEMQARRPSVSDVAQQIEVSEEHLLAIFPDPDSLLIAAAEQALTILIDECTRSVVKADPNDPVAQFNALGDAYLDWADRYRDEFRLISDSRLIDSLNTPSLRRYLDALSDLMARLLQRAKDRGQLHPQEDIAMMVMSARTFAFGVATMITENRMSAWTPGVDQVAAGKSLTHDFVRRMARSSQARHALSET